MRHKARLELGIGANKYCVKHTSGLYRETLPFSHFVEGFALHVGYAFYR